MKVVYAKSLDVILNNHGELKFFNIDGNEQDVKYLKKEIIRDILLILKQNFYPINCVTRKVIRERLNILNLDPLNVSTIKWEVELSGYKPNRTLNLFIKVNNVYIVYTSCMSNIFNSIIIGYAKIELLEGSEHRYIIVSERKNNFGLWQKSNDYILNQKLQKILKLWKNDLSLSWNELVKVYNKDKY